MQWDGAVREGGHPRKCVCITVATLRLGQEITVTFVSNSDFMQSKMESHINIKSHQAQLQTCWLLQC